MVQLCFAPQSVFRASKHRKLTKNHCPVPPPVPLPSLMRPLIY